MSYVARWDLDKTYLRTDFDTLRDLVRTAVERPDQKRTVPGAAALMREIARARIPVHILSGSPEQLRGRVVEKLRLDGVRFASLTLKPNLQNLLRLRLRALRGQLGYKLPALLRGRCELPAQRDARGELVREFLLGDDAEADAFVYSLYADLCRGVVGAELLAAVMRQSRAYDDDIADAQRMAAYIEPGPVVGRILIHLERQSLPGDFAVYGSRVVPFYNYLQAAFVLQEDGCLGAPAVLRVAQDLAGAHHFDGGSLARSYLDLARRGHAAGAGIGALSEAFSTLVQQGPARAASELGEMVSLLVQARTELPPPPSVREPRIDYLALVPSHDPRRSKT
ncbi:MAG: hypothetical protein IT373_08145 [Polyangiaceae bacterium]|nr:hypothetical protein [Polyangiaceae bacterium]